MADLRRIIDFLVFTNLFVSLAVVSLLIEPVIFLEGRLFSPYFFFLFFATLCLYSFHRLYRMEKRTREEKKEVRHQWILENRKLFLTVFIGSVFSLFYLALFHIHNNTLYSLIPVIIIAIAYTVPMFPWKGEARRLREVPFLKIFLITSVVTYVTTIVPLLEMGIAAIEPWLPLIIRRFLFIFAITIPFDIRDIIFDQEHDVKTIPGTWGAEKAIYLGLTSLVIFLFSLGFEYFYLHYISVKHAMALVLSVAITAGILLYSKEKKSAYHYTFLLEGMMLVQGLLLLCS